MLGLKRDIDRLHLLRDAAGRTEGDMHEIWRAHEKALQSKLRELAAEKWPALKRVKGD